MQKKAQLTIFIALGIVLVGIVILLSFMSTRPVEVGLETQQIEARQSSSTTDNFKYEVTDCLREKVIDALVLYKRQNLTYFDSAAGEDANISMNEFVKTYLKITGYDCFQSEISNLSRIGITLPLSVSVTENDNDYSAKIFLPTTREFNGIKTEIPDYSISIAKEELMMERNIKFDFDITPSVAITDSEEYVPSEIIVSYKSQPMSKNQYNTYLESLYVKSREPMYDQNLLFVGDFDEETRPVVESIIYDEIMVFDENKISFDDLRNELLALDFVDDVTRNAVSYPHAYYTTMSKISQNYLVNDPFYKYQWYLENRGQFFGVPDADIDIEKAWEHTRGSNGVVVSVIDEGIARNEDLVNNIIYGKCFDFVEKNYDIFPTSDREYHGTHVAGIIAAQANNLRGTAGICPECKIINMRVMDSKGKVDSKVMINAVLTSVARGAKVISMSLGGKYYSKYEEKIFKQLSDKGIVFVAAAGNYKGETKIYPAAYNGVIAVGSTDNADAISDFSSRGSWVDIYAPGETILSQCGRNTYCFSSGTSMAAPVVSGVIGLIKSKDSKLSSNEIALILKKTGDTIEGGNKRVNAGKALEFVSG